MTRGKRQSAYHDHVDSECKFGHSPPLSETSTSIPAAWIDACDMRECQVANWTTSTTATLWDCHRNTQFG